MLVGGEVEQLGPEVTLTRMLVPQAVASLAVPQHQL